jgi:hypothetical protein
MDMSRLPLDFEQILQAARQRRPWSESVLDPRPAPAEALVLVAQLEEEIERLLGPRAHIVQPTLGVLRARLETLFPLAGAPRPLDSQPLLALDTDLAELEDLIEALLIS